MTALGAAVLSTLAALVLDAVSSRWSAGRAEQWHRVWLAFIGVVAASSAAALAATADGSLATWLVALVSAAGLLQLVAGWWRVRRIAGLAEAPPAVRAARLGQTEHAESPRVLLHPRLQTALTWGWREPVVMLPAAWAGWPLDRLDAVVRHELAHVRRRDYLTGLAVAAVGAVLWFLPGLWIARRRLRWFAELAADAEAASTMGRNIYARHLMAAGGIRPGEPVPFRLQFAPGQVTLVNRAGTARDELRRRVEALLSTPA